MAYDFSQLRKQYDEVLTVVGDDLKTIKTGRAKPSLVEDVMVEAYSTRMRLVELASITAPDTQTILISPWDQSVIEAVQKALMTGPQGFNPAVDGSTIRINIAPLTGEKRQELVKLVWQKIESGKQMMRNERTEGKKEIEAQKGGAGVSEDDIEAELEKLEEVTKEYMGKLEEIGKGKEEELTTL